MDKISFLERKIETRKKTKSKTYYKRENNVSLFTGYVQWFISIGYFMLNSVSG